MFAFMTSYGPGRDWYFIAGQPAPAPHLAHPEGYAALHIVLVTVPRPTTVPCLARKPQAPALPLYVRIQTSLDSYMTVVSDSHYQSTLDAVYVYVVSWSEFPIVPSFQLNSMIRDSGLGAMGVGSEGRRARWGTPTMALHEGIQHRE